MSSQTSFSKSTDGRVPINNLNARNAHVCLKSTTIRYILSLYQLYQNDYMTFFNFILNSFFEDGTYSGL